VDESLTNNSLSRAKVMHSFMRRLPERKPISPCSPSSANQDGSKNNSHFDEFMIIWNTIKFLYEIHRTQLSEGPL
jgi:hypothetical protein